MSDPVTQADLKDAESRLHARISKVEVCVHKAEARLLKWFIGTGHRPRGRDYGGGGRAAGFLAACVMRMPTIGTGRLYLATLLVGGILAAVVIETTNAAGDCGTIEESAMASMATALVFVIRGK